LNSIGTLSVGLVNGSLATIEHGIVADDARAPKPSLIGYREQLGTVRRGANTSGAALLLEGFQEVIEVE
jgi:hypothetical protein